MTPEQRFRIASELNDMRRELQRTGIRHRHPEYSEEEVRIAHCRLILGDDLFIRVYPDSLHIVP
jgi:hypothetical protein